MPEERIAIVVGTAGHIDHGKTALVRALTGVDTDRLEEEKRRGITIDLGFAPLDLEGGIHIGFVDVPGHERFVKNMLAGAGGIDAVLIVVAADESVMPQTREHLEICDLLGINNAVVAVSKTDLADRETVELVTLEMSELLETTRFSGSPIVPISAETGEGLDELRKALSSLAEKVIVRSESDLPRLPVDRIFTMKGFGTVVTGTLISGRLIPGEAVEILPSRKKSTIKSLQVHDKRVEEATAGHRVAINLAGVGKGEVQRGETITLPGKMSPTALVDLHCRLLSSSPCELIHNQRIRFHHGSAELIGRLQILSGKSIEPGESGLVRIRLEAPTAALIGDHYVIRRYSPMITIGGGIVLDNSPGLIRNRDSLLAYLEDLRRLDVEGRCGLVVEHRLEPTDAHNLVMRFGILEDRAEDILRSLVDSGKAVILSESPTIVYSTSIFSTVQEKILASLEEAHRRSPLADGIQTESLRRGLGRAAEDLIFKAALDRLKEEGKIKIKEGLATSTGHSVELTPAQKEMMREISSEFKNAGATPPYVAEVLSKQANEKEARKILELLASRGEIVKVAEGLYFHQEVIDGILKKTSARAPADGFSVPEFKTWFGISRKYAIPLLEYLDSKEITYRDGDKRRLSRIDK